MCVKIAAMENLSRGAADERSAALAGACKALGDPTRVGLVFFIASQPGGEACVCELVEWAGLSQPTVSHHMRQLVDAGLVRRQQRGRWAYYSLVDSAFDSLGAGIRRIAAVET